MKNLQALGLLVFVAGGLCVSAFSLPNETDEASQYYDAVILANSNPGNSTEANEQDSVIAYDDDFELPCFDEGTESVNKTSHTCICKEGWTTAPTRPDERVYCNVPPTDVSDVRDADSPQTDSEASNCDESFGESSCGTSGTKTSSGIIPSVSGGSMMSFLLVIILILVCLSCFYTKNGTLPACCGCCLPLSTSSNEDP